MDLKCSLFILLCIYLCFATERSIKKYVPDTKCNATTTIPLLHVTATNVGNKDDAIHYIISTLRRPTIVIKHVMKPSKVTFNKTNICSESGQTFSFDRGGTSELSGLIITKLFSYVDTQDNVLPNSKTKYSENIIDNFDWKSVDSNGNEMVFQGINHISIITLTLNVRERSGHGEKQPKNPINANLTEFRFEFRNLTIKHPRTRYALEVLFFSTEHKTNSAASEALHSTTQYIDDEYTPGIFEIWAVKFLRKLSHIKQTYVTWKPVSYNGPDWSRSEQGLVYKYLFEKGKIVNVRDKPNPLPSYTRSIAWTLVNAMGASYYGVNISFGIPKDGFYNKNKYLSWSGMVGSGTPPVDSMSMKIILSIAVGLGIPAIAIIAGILFLLIKRVMQSAESSYDEIH